MKRIISLCCIALILVTSMAVPARADEVNSNWIHLLDFDSADGYGGNVISVPANSTKVINYEFPYQLSVFNVDLVFTSAYPLNSVSFTFGGSSTVFDGDLIQISDNLYRVVADLQGWGGTSLNVNFNGGSSSAFVTVLRFDVSSLPVEHYMTDAYAEVEAGAYYDLIHYVPTDTVNHRKWTATSDIKNNYLTIYGWCDNWKKYDFMDWQFTISASSINSITCIMGETNIPIDVSIVNPTNQIYNDFYISIRVDLTGLDRSTSDYPMLLIEGNVISGGLTVVSVNNVSGGIWRYNVSPILHFIKLIYSHILTGFSSLNSNLESLFSSLFSELDENFIALISKLDLHFSDLDTWITNHKNAILNSLNLNFTQLSSWISSQTESFGNFITDHKTAILNSLNANFTQLRYWLESHTNTLENAIRGDTEPGDSFQQQVDQKDQEFEDMAAVMDSVEMPDINNIDVSVDNIVSPADVQLLATPLTVFFNGQIFSQMIIMSILLATVSFVLFGKR